jgi:hypothetical protein
MKKLRWVQLGSLLVIALMLSGCAWGEYGNHRGEDQHERDHGDQGDRHGEDQGDHH